MLSSVHILCLLKCEYAAYVGAELLRRVWLFVTPWTVACQIPLSIEFSRQEYWSWLSFPTPGDLPNPGIEARCPALAGGFFTTEPHGKPCIYCVNYLIKKDELNNFVGPTLHVVACLRLV